MHFSWWNQIDHNFAIPQYWPELTMKFEFFDKYKTDLSDYNFILLNFGLKL